MIKNYYIKHYKQWLRQRAKKDTFDNRQKFINDSISWTYAISGQLISQKEINYFHRKPFLFW